MLPCEVSAAQIKGGQRLQHEIADALLQAIARFLIQKRITGDKRHTS
jgi:hypothetical protein